jgi:hypothetical protein
VLVHGKQGKNKTYKIEFTKLRRYLTIKARDREASAGAIAGVVQVQVPDGRRARRGRQLGAGGI